MRKNKLKTMKYCNKVYEDVFLHAYKRYTTQIKHYSNKAKEKINKIKVMSCVRLSPSPPPLSKAKMGRGKALAISFEKQMILANLSQDFMKDFKF